MKIKYVGEINELGLVTDDVYEVIDVDNSMGGVTILDQSGSPLWLFAEEVELVK